MKMVCPSRQSPREGDGKRGQSGLKQEKHMGRRKRKRSSSPPSYDNQPSMEDQAIEIRRLFAKAPILSTSDQPFADELLKQFERLGRLSDKQWEWVTILADRAENRETMGAVPSSAVAVPGKPCPTCGQHVPKPSPSVSEARYTHRVPGHIPAGVEGFSPEPRPADVMPWA